MKKMKVHDLVRPCLAIGGAFVMVMTLSACQTPQEERRADHNTCAEMGARYGSPSHTKCMLQQQQRRDQANLNLLAEQRMHQELAREAREAFERKRREKREKRGY